MSFFGSQNLGSGRPAMGQSLSRSETLGRQYQPFSNPFFDLASTYTPPTVKALFGFCRFFHLTHGMINAINTKAAEYPVTDLLLSQKDSGVRQKWEELMHGVLNYRVHQFEVNLDFFCFAAETPVVTRTGTFSIKELAGETVEVLSRDGVWRSATFKAYGKQRLYEVVLAHGETLIATAEHQWPSIDTNKRERSVTTLELKNRYLIRNAAPRPDKNADYWDGVRHGIIFGDGTLSNGGRQAHLILYAVGKKQELARYFEGYTVTPHYAGDYLGVYGLPPAYKALPAVEASNSYWYGFVCGLLATDGSIDPNGQSCLHQKHGKGLNTVAQQLPRIGMLGKPVRTRTVTTEFGTLDMDRVGLITSFMQAEDFLLSDQRACFEEEYGEETPYYGKKVKVKAIQETGRFETVYCCVELETHTFTVGNGVLTGNCYGNAFVSPSLPFTKILTCASCNAIHSAVKIRANWRYNNQGFWLSCPKCGQSGWAKPRDDYYPRLGEMNLIRWNPELITIFCNETTGRTDYTLDFTAEFKNYIAMGRKDLVATTPQPILEALKLQRTLVLDSNAVFHMRRPGPSQMMQRWGVPMVMPVLKDAYYMQVMKKAQEQVLLQHLLPQIFLFPQPATGGADPFTSVNLIEWRSHIQRELARQRLDPNYYGILPFPLGHQQIGENGKSLMLMPEIQSMAEHICIGMGFPVDLVFGNGTYAGSSVNMRMLENFFLSNINGHMRLVQWVIKHFATFLNWPRPDARFKAFRMADDIQRQQIMMQAVQSDMISKTTFLSQMDLKVEDEAKLRVAELGIEAEAIKKKNELMAEVQGSQQTILAKFQAKAQATTQNTAALEAMSKKSPFDSSVGSGLSGPAGVTLDAVAAALAKEITLMPPERAERWLSQLRSQVPEMAQMVAEQQGAGLPAVPVPGGEAPQGGAPPSPGGSPPIDMRPQPVVLPPRRPGGV